MVAEKTACASRRKCFIQCHLPLSGWEAQVKWQILKPLGINFFTGKDRVIPRQERHKNDFALINQKAEVAGTLQFS